MAVFRRFIVVPFEKGGDGRTAACERLGLLLDSACLRRTKDLLHLPDQQEITRFLEFSTVEREQYEQTKKIMVRAIRQNVEGVKKKIQLAMFHVLLQLRLLCNHGTFQHHFSWVKPDLLNEQEAALCSVGQNGEVNCSCCRQSLPILGTNRVYRTYVEHCAHVLCLECLDEKAQESTADENGAMLRCPLCPPSLSRMRDAADDGSAKQTDQHDDYFLHQGHSSKMEALISDVQQDLWKRKRQVNIKMASTQCSYSDFAEA